MSSKKGRNGGQNRKPAHLALVDGTKPSRINHEAPRPKAQDPEPSEYVTARAGELWEKYVGILGEGGYGCLTKGDGEGLAAYCQALARFEEAERSITEHGMVALVETPKTYLGKPIVLEDGSMVMERQFVKNPAVDIALKLHAQLRGWVGLFGLTPVDRERLKVPAKPKGKDPLAGIG